MPNDRSPPPEKDPALDAVAGTLADKIQWLINHMWPRELDPPKTDDDVAMAIQDRTGEELSRSTVWKLRTGRQPNPTLRTLKAFATFFNVPIGFFGDAEEAEAIEGQLTMLALLRDSGVDRAALRALVDLSPAAKQMIAEMIASAARMEQNRSTTRPEPGRQPDPNPPDQ